MKITFIGLSCFLLENDQGDRLLIDPYHDSPEHYLGLTLPADIQADIFLVSHPDADHSNLRSEWIRKKRPSHIKDESSSTLFPDFDLKGALVKEWNGDLNIAYSFTIDGIRFLHLADNAHVLTSQQLSDIGSPDIIFMSPPKIESTYHIENITVLNPKLVIPSHYIPIKTYDPAHNKLDIEQQLEKRLLQPWVTNPHASAHTARVLAHMFLAAERMKDHFPNSKDILTHSLEISKNDLPQKTAVYVFRQCLGV